MWKKIVLAGSAAAVVLGSGGVAMAATGTGTGTGGTAAASSKSLHPAHLKHLEHGSWITKAKDGTEVAHTAFRGAASSVTSSSITVTAADGTVQAFGVDPSTKVRTKAQHKGASIGAVQNGDTVVVVGTGSGAITAARVSDSSR